MRNFFRPNIEKMAGYTPGEQPKMAKLVKLNTNENAYPPSPEVAKALQNVDVALLRRYPDPNADALRARIAQEFHCAMDQVIIGNGSDDILTMTFRAFTAPDRPVACLDPSYSLYPVLALMEEAQVIRIALSEEDFSLPDDLLEQAKGANLLILTRPNAPTGNSFPLERIRTICEKFDGVVFIDEAYADFAEDNCMELACTMPNVIVSRTFSKSYSLAGLRLGFAVADAKIIDGMFKLKDSYNVDKLAQTAGLAAFSDREYLKSTCEKIRHSRAELAQKFKEAGFRVTDSQSNFLFVSPPDRDGERYFRFLRDHAVIVRYFPAEKTREYVRITIGNPEEIKVLLEVTEEYLR